MSATFLEIAVPNCSAEDFDGEVVAINLDSGIYYSLKDDSALLWNDLVAGHSVQSLQALATGNDTLVQAISDFAAELVQSGLMRETSTAPAPAGVAGTAAAIATMQPPVLESFGDMQSLLLLDPVHEVDDDAGWPQSPGK